MSLVQEDIDNIEELVRKLVTDMTRRARSFHDYDEIELRERAIRVEEELKHQRELMMEGFKQMEKRFEQVEKRFEQMQLETNKRFEQVDKRFEQMQLEMNKRFEQMQLETNKRFEQVDKRFEQLTARIDRFMLWSFTITVSVGGLVVALIKLT
jgi:DNA anti-recombination protein RmuC